MELSMDRLRQHAIDHKKSNLSRFFKSGGYAVPEI